MVLHFRQPLASFSAIDRFIREDKFTSCSIGIKNLVSLVSFLEDSEVGQHTTEILSLAQEGISTPEGNGAGNLRVRRPKVSSRDGKKVTPKTNSPVDPTSSKVHDDLHSANGIKERFWHPPQASTREYVTLLHVQGSASDVDGPI